MYLNLFRKPFRTALTIFGVAVALFLFCFLEATLDAFNVGVNMADASRLVVMHKESLAFNLPFAHKTRIEQVEGVKRAAGAIWFGGPYEEPTPGGEKKDDFFSQFATDLESYMQLYPEIRIDPAQARDLMSDQQGCVLGDKVAARIGKKVGDKLVFKGAIWPRADGMPWEFNVRAIYTTDSPTFDRT
ncbi:MAG TPA: ABC transporter permease, partial [Planctomycetota bacterium]|nr:ABC transporter permease [Planctomycetota bacterium]